MLSSCLFSSAQCRPIERHYAKSIVRCICACGLCTRANNFRVRRYLSEYIETEMVEVTNPGKRRNAGTEYACYDFPF